MLKPILEVARHELVSASRSKRLWAITVLYLGSALMGGAGYAWTLNQLRAQLIESMVASGANPLTASAMVSMVASKGYDEMVARLGGIETAQLHPDFQTSFMIPALVWGLQAFLPSLITLSCYDYMTSELQARSLNFNLLRVSRSETLAGKTLAWAGVLGLLVVVGSGVLLTSAQAMLDMPFPPATYWLALKYVLLLLPFMLTYLAMTTLASVHFTRPTAALWGAMLLAALLASFATIKFLAASRPALQPFTFLVWLAPRSYEPGIWQTGWTAAATSVGAYLAFAAGLYALADLRLRKRDL